MPGCLASAIAQGSVRQPALIKRGEAHVSFGASAHARVTPRGPQMNRSVSLPVAICVSLLALAGCKESGKPEDAAKTDGADD